MILADTTRNWYADGGISALGYNPEDIWIAELHMDSFTSSSARGAHVCIHFKFEADEWDRALAAKLSEIFPGRAETIVGRNLGNSTRAATRGFNYRLCENGFITNAGDVEVFNSRMDDIARAYLEAFGIDAGEAVAAEPAPKPEPAAPAAASSGSEHFCGGKYRCNVDALNVRARPSLSGEVVASYGRGQTVWLDNWYCIADGYVWARYTGRSGKTRYIAVGPHTGKPEPDGYLVKA